MVLPECATQWTTTGCSVERGSSTDTDMENDAQDTLVY